MNNFPCVNSILIDRHLASIEDDDGFNDWLVDYEMTDDNFNNIIETLLDQDELLIIHNAIQFIFVNELEEGQLAEARAMTQFSPEETLHYIAAYVDEMDIDELAAMFNTAYQRNGTKQDYLLNGLEDAVIYYLDNDSGIRKKYDDYEEARHNEY